MQTLSWRSALHLQRRSACMGGCLGGYVRATAAAALPSEKTPTNRPEFKKKTRQSMSARSSSQQQDQYWMSNSHDMDSDNRIMFHSKPTVHDSNHNNRQEPSSFENRALKHWHKQRQEWVGRPKPGQQQRGLQREPVIKWSSTYEELLGTSRPFTQPVPLPEMVDFLVDVWEQEGLYG